MVRRNRDSYVENLMAAPNAPPNAAEGELSSPSRDIATYHIVHAES